MFLRIVTVLALYAANAAGEDASGNALSLDEHPAWSFIPKETCGEEAGRSKIVGGIEATPGQFPWYARLGKFEKKCDKMHVEFACGGALITKFYVLSAAHCGTDFDIVRLGQYRNDSENCGSWKCGPPAQDIPIDRFIVNENFDIATEHNDIMLIELTTPAGIDDSINPICLPRGELLTKNFEGESFRVAGWGRSDMKKVEYSNKLLFVDLPLMEDDMCKIAFWEPVLESQYCIGMGGGKDACFGDSGSPMTKVGQIEAQEQTFIFGIVSYGVHHCGTGPGIYTRVISFIPWILEHIKKY